VALRGWNYPRVPRSENRRKGVTGLTVAEVFEFGRRLYQEDTTVDAVTFRITIEDVLGRPASGDSINDPLSGDRARQNAARHAAELPRADLAAGILEPSAAAAGSLFGSGPIRPRPRTPPHRNG
jgi:hypothetical protein